MPHLSVGLHYVDSLSWLNPFWLAERVTLVTCWLAPLCCPYWGWTEGVFTGAGSPASLEWKQQQHGSVLFFVTERSLPLEQESHDRSVTWCACCHRSWTMTNVWHLCIHTLRVVCGLGWIYKKKTCQTLYILRQIFSDKLCLSFVLSLAQRPGAPQVTWAVLTHKQFTK